MATTKTKAAKGKRPLSEEAAAAVAAVTEAPKRRHESPALLTEALTEAEGRIVRYFDKSIAAGEIPQDALQDIQALIALGDKASKLADELKDKLVEHKERGGTFAPGKMIVQVAAGPSRTTVPWKDEWGKVFVELARLKGESDNLEKAETIVKLNYPAKPGKVSAKIIVGD